MQDPAKLLSQIDVLLREARILEARQILRGLVPDTLSEEHVGLYYVLMSEIALQAGEYSPSYIELAIESLRHHPSTQLFARAKYLQGWDYAAKGEFLAAIESLTEANAHYLRCEDFTGSAMCLSRLAYCQAQSGRYDSASLTLERCIQLHRGQGNIQAEIRVANNLGKVHWLAGRLKDSNLVFALYRNSELVSDAKAYALSMLMSALPLATAGQVEAARRLILKAEPLLQPFVREKAVCHENLGRIELLSGRYDLAETALTKGLQISLDIAPESALVSQIKRLFGDLYVATERWELAEKYTTEGLAVAEKINERIEIAACWRVFAQIELHRDHQVQVREWFEKSIDLFNLIGARYELAVTRYLAATSGLYVNGERAALLYLAREYFVSEDIRHYVEKVDKALRAEPYRPAKSAAGNGQAPAIISRSEIMQRVLDLAQRVAGSERPVLLTGETGTGKDLLARYIHYHSGRSGEFVPVNTAAIPTEMIEAELFGHTKGAFTGAAGERAGLVEQAAEGTLYLNEIGDANPEFQAKLLEVLETRQMRRLGQDKLRPVTCRFIAATNHDLQARIRENRFRLDLYHRLNHLSLAIPPLRERVGDIPLLVEHFLQAEGFAPNANGDRAALKRLSLVLAARPWPGNVRQLQAEIQRLSLMSKAKLDVMVDLALEESGDSEEEQLLAVLEATGWNRRQTARILGVSEGAVRKRMLKYRLQTSDE